MSANYQLSFGASPRHPTDTRHVPILYRRFANPSKLSRVCLGPVLSKEGAPCSYQSYLLSDCALVEALRLRQCQPHLRAQLCLARILRKVEHVEACVRSGEPV